MPAGGQRPAPELPHEAAARVVDIEPVLTCRPGGDREGDRRGRIERVRRVAVQRQLLRQAAGAAGGQICLERHQRRAAVGIGGRGHELHAVAARGPARVGLAGRQRYRLATGGQHTGRVTADNGAARGVDDLDHNVGVVGERDLDAVAGVAQRGPGQLDAEPQQAQARVVAPLLDHHATPLARALDAARAVVGDRHERHMEGARPGDAVGQARHGFQRGGELHDRARARRRGVEVAPAVGVQRADSAQFVAPLADPGQPAAVVAQVHQAAVVRIGHVDVVGGRAAVAPHRQRQRTGETARAAAQPADRTGARGRAAAQREAHDLVATGVGDVEAVVAVVQRRAAVRAGDIPRRAEPVDDRQRLQAQLVELGDGAEDQHAVVARVGHEDAVVPVGGQAARLAQRPEGRAGAVERRQVTTGLARHQAVPGRVGHHLEVAGLQVREAVVDVDVPDDDRRPGRAEQVAVDQLACRAAGQGVDARVGQVRRGRERAGRRGRGREQRAGDRESAQHVRLPSSSSQNETRTPVS